MLLEASKASGRSLKEQPFCRNIWKKGLLIVDLWEISNPTRISLQDSLKWNQWLSSKTCAGVGSKAQKCFAFVNLCCCRTTIGRPNPKKMLDRARTLENVVNLLAHILFTIKQYETMWLQPGTSERQVVSTSWEHIARASRTVCEAKLDHCFVCQNVAFETATQKCCNGDYSHWVAYNKSGCGCGMAIKTKVGNTVWRRHFLLITFHSLLYRFAPKPIARETALHAPHIGDTVVRYHHYPSWHSHPPTLPRHMLSERAMGHTPPEHGMRLKHIDSLFPNSVLPFISRSSWHYHTLPIYQPFWCYLRVNKWCFFQVVHKPTNSRTVWGSFATPKHFKGTNHPQVFQDMVELYLQIVVMFIPHQNLQRFFRIWLQQDTTILHWKINIPKWLNIAVALSWNVPDIFVRQDSSIQAVNIDIPKLPAKGAVQMLSSPAGLEPTSLKVCDAGFVWSREHRTRSGSNWSLGFLIEDTSQRWERKGLMPPKMLALALACKAGCNGEGEVSSRKP